MYLQYIITLASCGMRDGPDQSLTISESMDRLVAYDEARRSLSWKKLEPIPLPQTHDEPKIIAGCIVSHNGKNVLVYQPPSPLRGIKEKIWKHEFNIPGYRIYEIRVEPAEDLLLLEMFPTDNRFELQYN